MTKTVTKEQTCLMDIIAGLKIVACLFKNFRIRIRITHRHTHRQTHTQTHTHRDRNTDRHTHRGRHTHPPAPTACEDLTYNIALVQPQTQIMPHTYHAAMLTSR